MKRRAPTLKPQAQALNRLAVKGIKWRDRMKEAAFQYIYIYTYIVTYICIHTHPYYRHFVSVRRSMANASTGCQAPGKPRREEWQFSGPWLGEGGRAFCCCSWNMETTNNYQYKFHLTFSYSSLYKLLYKYTPNPVAIAQAVTVGLWSGLCLGESMPIPCRVG